MQQGSSSEVVRFKIVITSPPKALKLCSLNLGNPATSAIVIETVAPCSSMSAMFPAANKALAAPFCKPDADFTSGDSPVHFGCGKDYTLLVAVAVTVAIVVVMYFYEY